RRRHLYGLSEFVGPGSRPGLAEEPSRRWGITAFGIQVKFGPVHRQSVARDEPCAGEYAEDESGSGGAGAHDSNPRFLGGGDGLDGVKRDLAAEHQEMSF